MKVIANYKYSSKLKFWSDKMPNAPYLNRYMHSKKLKFNNEYDKLKYSSYEIKSSF